ncbi:P-II family nitrogen regulator [Dehalogenimonas etheniformans]|uniref:P-II family nitrogen regulator n=1 Tax=Dehalogenimonas etheniformans TaxID=1536648 RepID=A0A2P5P944_9CHLR|nr:P-II family nitrogen regulator [Dehalogenimonas etheniformans]PPD58806.1 P-II family nitrogen regulator [Dehalogenimonas etheniformans]QNT76425.1 P-II family nitrogen regulator [Dehalogenimonas etheniformans]
MKKIEAIIREERLDAVKKALEEIGLIGMTVTKVSGRGQQKGIPLQWRVGEYRVDFLPKLKIEIICHDDDCNAGVEVIMKAAKTGRIGDGKIFVLPVEAAYCIRTAETDEAVV